MGTFGRYDTPAKAYYALSQQTESDRFYVEREGDVWLLKLARR